jgi:acyl-coenzyme A synthetase/AMP-(fatty) acid ligase
MSPNKGEPMTMTLTRAPTVLTQGQRYSLANDYSFGGGNLLAAAIRMNPHPEIPFIRPVSPVAGIDGDPIVDLSLLDLDELAQSWSVWYLAQGVTPRDRVAIYLPDCFAYTIHYLALAQIGAIPVLVNSRAPGSSAAALLAQTTPVGLYTDEPRLERLSSIEPEVLSALRWTTVAEDVPVAPRSVLPDSARFRHAPDDPVSLLHSSGTTGTPKPVIHTHRSSVAGPRFRMLSQAEAPGALMMTALPSSHLGCIHYTSYAILCGTPLVAFHDGSGAELHAAVKEYEPTSVMAFSHAYGELAALALPAGDLDSVDVWVTMGDAIHETHIRTILAQRSADRPPADFYDRLGTTELGWGVLLHVTTDPNQRKERCAGTPTGVAEVAILRRDGTEAGPEEFGFLGARGPGITVGYWNDADTTYRSKLAGYWLTGDIAYRDAEGLFYQVDRAVDAIETSAGPGYSVFMEEVVLSAVPEISDCAVVAGRWGGPPVAVAVVRAALEDIDAKLLIAAANDALRSAGHPKLAVLEVAKTEADYPCGVTGKVLKRNLRERYGDLSTYLTEDEDRILATDTDESDPVASTVGVR